MSRSDRDAGSRNRLDRHAQIGDRHHADIGHLQIFPGMGVRYAERVHHRRIAHDRMIGLYILIQLFDVQDLQDAMSFIDPDFCFAASPFARSSITSVVTRSAFLLSIFSSSHDLRNRISIMIAIAWRNAILQCSIRQYLLKSQLYRLWFGI